MDHKVAVKKGGKIWNAYKGDKGKKESEITLYEEEQDAKINTVATHCETVEVNK